MPSPYLSPMTSEGCGLLSGRFLHLRGYRPADVEAMQRLDVDCFSGPFQFDHETMKEAAEAKSAIVVISEYPDEIPGQIAGFVIAHILGEGADRYAYVVTIDVAPEMRRSGVGNGVLTQAENQARIAGAKSIGLHVAVDNESAILFYERQKYTCTGIVRRFYRAAKLDALMYAKAL